MSESAEAAETVSKEELSESVEESGEAVAVPSPAELPAAAAAAQPMDITEYQEQLTKLGFTLPGEEVKNIFNFVFVAVVGSSLSADIGGTLFVTNYQVIVVDFSGPEANLIYAVPMGTIHRLKAKKKAKTLELFCKDGRDLHMFFPGKLERDSAAEYIHRYAFPDHVHQLFAFIHQAYGGENEADLVSVEKDYVRQKMHLCKKFRITRINEDFSLCDTYPQTLVTLATISDDDLRKVAAFRSRNRLPAIVWKHPKKDSFLARCAQPCVGLKRAHSNDDERFIAELRVPGQQTMYVIDSRPKANAVANMMRGGGYELPNRYKEMTLEFSNIGNIHVMRKSLQAVMRTCQHSSPVKPMAEWTADLDASGWFEHMRLVLVSSFRVVELLQRNESVLVHCSDGWDRTAQTCTLAELLLDPFYRTIEGLIVLIEKEWLQFGHQFALRYGHGKQMDNFKESQRSPIFPQWVDILYQLTVLLPTHFEFNELLLHTLLEELYACRFGTFLCDSVKQRLEARTYTNTASLWSFVMHNRELFKNPNFKKTSKVVIPDLSKEKLRLWSGYYLRWKDNGMANMVVMEGSTAKTEDAKRDTSAAGAASPSASNKHHFATLTTGTMRSPSPAAVQRGGGAVLGDVDAERLFGKKRRPKSVSGLRGSGKEEKEQEESGEEAVAPKKRRRRHREEAGEEAGERKKKHRHKRKHRHRHKADSEGKKASRKDATEEKKEKEERKEKEEKKKEKVDKKKEVEKEKEEKQEEKKVEKVEEEEVAEEESAADESGEVEEVEETEETEEEEECTE